MTKMNEKWFCCLILHDLIFPFMLLVLPSNDFCMKTKCLRSLKMFSLYTFSFLFISRLSLSSLRDWNGKNGSKRRFPFKFFYRISRQMWLFKLVMFPNVAEKRRTEFRENFSIKLKFNHSFQLCHQNLIKFHGLWGLIWNELLHKFQFKLTINEVKVRNIFQGSFRRNQVTAVGLFSNSHKVYAWVSCFDLVSTF